MKLILALAAAIAVSSASVLREAETPYTVGDRFFYFAGDDGAMHLVDSEEASDDAFIADYMRNPANNEYWLFTRSNPTNAQYLIPNDAASVQGSNFDGRKPTVFISHGWNGGGSADMNPLLTEAFLQEDDVNVVVLCWRRLANRNYVTARNGVPAIGRALGEFIMWMTNFSLDYDRVHLVGFSLGGHLVGNTGRLLDGRIKRITALDPAGPLWYWNSDRLAQSDAQYVEVMHTSTNLGYTDPCGDTDFYPNGGTSQPGCWLSTCSHGRAPSFMASSIRYNHLWANECGSHRDASRDRCTGDLYPMGNADMNKNGSGIYRVNTGRNYPY